MATTDHVTSQDADELRHVDLLYPELGPARSVWRERVLRFRSYLDMREQLREQYPECWVAVVREDRVIVAPDLPSLHERLEEEGYDPQASVVKYLYTGSAVGSDLRAATQSFQRGSRRV